MNEMYITQECLALLNVHTLGFILVKLYLQPLVRVAIGNKVMRDRFTVCSVSYTIVYLDVSCSTLKYIVMKDDCKN